MAKITVLFDAEPLARAGKSGVSFYTEGLITALAALGTDNIELIGHYYGSPASKLPEADNINYVASRILPIKLVNLLRRFNIEIPFEFLVRTRGDFILYPNFIGHPSFFNTPSAPTIHDLVYVDLPGLVSARNLSDLTKFVPKTLKRSSLYLSVSKETAKAVTKHYPEIKTPVLVTPIAPEKPHEPQKNDKEIIKNFGIDRPYILFLGTLEPRKNLVNLLKAYGAMKNRDKYQLVLAGGTGWNDEELQYILSRKPGGVVLTGYTDAKGPLYANASAVVMPSFYEGFGMPILEAQTYGVPVAASDIAIFHEVAGNSIEYFNEADHMSIAHVLSKILENPNAQKQAAKENLKRYDWNKTAGDVYQVMLQVVAAAKAASANKPKN